MAQTYLDLAPNMGGTQFGPFTGAVQIGTDADQCQIVLNQSMGIAPVHVTVGDQGNGQYMIAPVQRGFGLFIVRAGTGSVTPIGGATPAVSGDAIVIGTPAGPRFTIRRVDGVGFGASAAGSSAGGSGLGGRVAKEMWRQQTARLMHRNPYFRDISKFMFRYRTGSLTNPRTIVAVLMSAGVVFAGLTAGCVGLVAAVRAGLFGN